MAVAVTHGEVLLVEDDAAIRDALRELLEAEGYVVQGAANGREALARLRGGGHRPRLILLDLMMPVMDGWEFRQAQRGDPALACIPVVVLSAEDGVEDKIAEMKVAGSLAKPFLMRELLEVIRRALERAALEPTAAGGRRARGLALARPA
jgi:DNA-binding response OmpR family regulator